MPVIQQYDAGNVQINPSETGINAREAAGRRIGAAYTEAGQRIGGAIATAGREVDDYLTHREISAGAKDGAEVINGLTNQWNDIAKNADPNDPTVAAKFKEQVLDPAIDQFKQGFGTSRSVEWADQFSNQFRQHMVEKTSADMSTLAGIAAKANAEQTVNQLSSAVANDPSSLPFALQTVDHSLGAMVDSAPNLKGTAAAAVKTEIGLKAKESIVKSAIIGMIQKNPNIDLTDIQQKYGQYINGAEMKMFQKAAQTQAKTDFIQQKQMETYQRQQEEHQAGAAASKVIADNFTVDANGKLAIKPDALPQALDIARKYPQAGPAQARAMIDFVEAQQNKELKPVDNPQVMRDLSDRMFDPDKPTTAIDLMRARTKGDITDHTYTQLHGMLKDMESTPLKGPIYQDTMKAVHDQLVINVPGIPGKDDIGTKNYALFVQSFVPQYLSKSRAGTLEPNALDVNDPNSMISKAMAPFKRTPAQRMQDYVNGAGGLSSAPGATPSPAAGRTVGGAQVPKDLGGIASLSYNPSKKLWRDDSSGKIYDAEGKEVR